MGSKQRPPTSRGAADELLTTEEAAEDLRNSPRTLERYRVTGEGPRFLKIGKLVRYRRSDLVAWRDSRERRSTSDPGPPPPPPTRSPKSGPGRRGARRPRRGETRPPAP